MSIFENYATTHISRTLNASSIEGTNNAQISSESSLPHVHSTGHARSLSRLKRRRFVVCSGLPQNETSRVAKLINLRLKTYGEVTQPKAFSS